MSTIIQQIKAEYRVTNEQLDRCTLVLECSTNHYFYQVESQTDPGTVYTVRYDQNFSKLTCTCKAGQVGIDCWHKRASVCDFAIQRLRRREAINALPDLEAIHQEQEAARHENAAVAAFGAKAYDREPFSLFR